MNYVDTALAQARAAFAQKDYLKAIGSLDDVVGQPNLSAAYFRLRARLIQLVDDPSRSLAEAEACLLKANELDPADSKVLIDLGYFYSRVMPDLAKSLTYFRRALDEMRNDYAAGMVGLTELITAPAEADELIENQIAKLRNEIATRL